MKFFILFLLFTMSAYAEDFGPRVETLKSHLDRLGFIVVTDDLSSAKQEKLDQLAERLKQDVTDEETFNQLYLEMDKVREWLLTHATDQPK
ncbi:MAG: hypothetical protein KC964_15745, partial [Candidatus Omnitrophica bacterium]|nr:hypothetical protein [Candidatus Omnitrophota bacterium]